MRRGEEQKEAKSVEEGNRGEGDWDGKSSFSGKFYVKHILMKELLSYVFVLPRYFITLKSHIWGLPWRASG